MSQRERWILYPLLFLALGAALRDKLIPSRLRPLSVDAITVRCAHLEVFDPDDPAPQPRAALRLGAVEQAGYIELYDKSGHAVLSLGPDDSGTRYGLYAWVPGRGARVPLSLYAMPELPAEAPQAESPKPGKTPPNGPSPE